MNKISTQELNQELKNKINSIGEVSNLNTNHKNNLVGAVNEVNTNLQNHKHDVADIISGVLPVDRIPNLPTSKITSGTFHIDRIPNIPGTKVTGSVSNANNAANADKVGGMTLEQIIANSSPFSNVTPKVEKASSTGGSTVTVVNVTGSGYLTGIYQRTNSSMSDSGSTGELTIIIDGVTIFEGSASSSHSYTSGYGPQGDYYETYRIRSFNPYSQSFMHPFNNSLVVRARASGNSSGSSRVPSQETLVSYLLKI